jgi:excisionase family DNA binding protein
MGDLSPKEAAEQMGISRSLVYRLVEQGELDAYQVSNRLRIPIEGIDKLRARKRVEPRLRSPVYEPAPPVGFTNSAPALRPPTRTHG